MGTIIGRAEIYYLRDCDMSVLGWVHLHKAGVVEGKRRKEQRIGRQQLSSWQPRIYGSCIHSLLHDRYSRPNIVKLGYT